MTQIFSYVLKYDTGAAPNPFGGVCTLTICKPMIRRNAKIGDWIIGTGSQSVKCNDYKLHNLSNQLVYAMKVSDIKSLNDYDKYCNESLKVKIPDFKGGEWYSRVGDCIYDFSKNKIPAIRISVHDERNRSKDLGGINALISNHFYYFGENPILLPQNLFPIVKKNQGHRKIEDIGLITAFEIWINQFEKNKLYADPQMRWKFDRNINDNTVLECSKHDLEEDQDDSEEIIC